MVAVDFLVTFLAKALLAHLLILARWLTVARVLVVSDFFHFTIIEFILLLRTLNVEVFFNLTLALSLEKFFQGVMKSFSLLVI